MNTACPTCGTEYAVAAKDVGRRIGCAKCGTHLSVTSAGLVADSVSAPSQSMVERQPTNDLTSLWRRADWPTLGIGVGAVLVLWFIFMPIIAASNVERQNAIL